MSPRSQPPGQENEPLLSAAPRPLCGPLLWQPRESHRGLVSPGVKSRPHGAMRGLTPASGGHCDSPTSQGRGLGEKRGGFRAGQPPARGRPLCSDAVASACPRGRGHPHTLRLLPPHRPRPRSASPVSWRHRFTPACESVSVHAPAAAPPLLTLTGR